MLVAVVYQSRDTFHLDFKWYQGLFRCFLCHVCSTAWLADGGSPSKSKFQNWNKVFVRHTYLILSRYEWDVTFDSIGPDAGGQRDVSLEHVSEALPLVVWRRAKVYRARHIGGTVSVRETRKFIALDPTCNDKKKVAHCNDPHCNWIFTAHVRRIGKVMFLQVSVC